MDTLDYTSPVAPSYLGSYGAAYWDITSENECDFCNSSAPAHAHTHSLRFVGPVSFSGTNLRRPASSFLSELREARMLTYAHKARQTVQQDFAEKNASYAGIAAQHVANAAFLVAGVLGCLHPDQVTTTLTYEQSLHVRAELPLGAGSIHVSVLFTPGLDPTQHLGQREEEDNTVISVFGADGNFTTSAEGPLLQALSQVASLLAPLRLPWAMAA